MKLLSKQKVDNRIKRERDVLLEDASRLRKYIRQQEAKLSTIKDDYSRDKLEALKEFEAFVGRLHDAKDKLLKEYNDVNEEIKKRQEVYYGLVEKQDALDEREYQIQRKEQKLNDREGFIKQLEAKWQKRST